jgi:hypothetical protein
MFIHLIWMGYLRNSSQEIPLPKGATLARRTGQYLCVADKEHYNVIDIEKASLFPILPLSQASEPLPAAIKPSITVISEREFLILSWTGSGTIGIFITGDGDPVRGTLEWPSHPDDVCELSLPFSNFVISVDPPLQVLTTLISPHFFQMTRSRYTASRHRRSCKSFRHLQLANPMDDFASQVV